MIQIEFTALEGFLLTNWGWAAGLGAAMLALTAFAAGILTQGKKDSLSLWLMGAETEETWATRFAALFDAVFGSRHLSVQCFVRSAIASLVAVVLIWGLMGIGGAYALRLQADLALGEVLLYALAINIVADYVSLLETRWLIGWLARPRPFIVHVAVVLADLVLTGAIIWFAILAFIASPFYPGEAESFAEILGVFSMFSVLFYSTFLTSVWSWTFIASAWILRAFRGLRLADWFDVQNKPLRILGLVMAGAVFLGSLATAAAFRQDADGLTALDRGLCSVFKGDVCLDVAGLTESQQAHFDLLLSTCENVVDHVCMARAVTDLGVEVNEATDALDRLCSAGNPYFCTRLGYLNENGIGMAPDPAEAARLYRQGCEGGNALGCTNLGYLHEAGIGMDPDPAEAARLFRQGCNLGRTVACGWAVDLEAELAATPD